MHALKIMSTICDYIVCQEANLVSGRFDIQNSQSPKFRIESTKYSIYAICSCMQVYQMRQLFESLFESTSDTLQRNRMERFMQVCEERLFTTPIRQEAIILFGEMNKQTRKGKRRKRMEERFWSGLLRSCAMSMVEHNGNPEADYQVANFLIT